MAFENKTRPFPAAGQAPAAEVSRDMVATVVQETIRAEFDRFLEQMVELLSAPYGAWVPRAESPGSAA